MARGGAAAFINGLTQGYEAGRKMYKDYELSQVMNAKPEEMTGYKAADGEQLKAMSEATAPDGSKYYTIGNDDKGNYTVTPNFGDDPKQIVMQQGTRTAFLGQEHDGKLTEEKMSAIRNSKMADVLAKYDPLQAEAVRRGNKQAELMDLQISGAKRQEDIAKEQEEKRQTMKNIDGSLMELAHSVIKKDAYGNAIPPGPEEMYKISKARTDLMLNNGFFDEAQAGSQVAMKYMSEYLNMNKAQRQADADKAKAMAAAGNYQGAMGMYNAYLGDEYEAVSAGKDKDGKIVVQRIDKASGKPAEPLVFENNKHFDAALGSIADGSAMMNYQQQQFDNGMKQRQLANSERQTSISGANLALAQKKDAREASQEEEKRAAGEGYYKEENPGATQAKLRAVRAGVLPVVPKANEYKVEAGDVTTLLGTQATNDKGQPILDMNGKPIVTRNPVNERQLFEYMERNGITDTNKGLAMFIAQQNRNSFKTEAEAEAAFKAGKIKPGQMVTVGGRTGTWK